METKHISFPTLCVHNFQKKKQNILLCSIATSLLLMLVKTSSKSNYIQNDLILRSQGKDGFESFKGK